MAIVLTTRFASDGFLAWIGKRRAIRRYLRVLPRRLWEDYGHQGPYTPAQVETSIRRHKVSSPRYAPFAVALFCDATHSPRSGTEDRRAPNHDALRRELAWTYFGGDENFSVRDVARHWTEHRGGFHAAHGADVGGHHGFGDGGGHH